MADPLALTGADIDRVDDRRRLDDSWLAAQRADPAARGVVLGNAGLRGSDGQFARIRMDRIDLMGLPKPVFLGLDAEGPLFAIDEDQRPHGQRPRLIGAGGMRGEAPPEAAGRIGLREAAQTLSHAEGGLLAYAAGLLNWHRAHQHCANCGTASYMSAGGMVRICPSCGVHHHPRTDPVVIMLVTDGSKRVLLGRQSAWPPRRYSALAGFVSHGESLEEAVAREVMEEVGVRVGPPDYVASQPWPFPHSLMLGFEVPWAGGEIGIGDEELEHAAWFSRDEVAAAVQDDGWDTPAEGDGLLLPPRSAIARVLVERWVRDPG